MAMTDSPHHTIGADHPMLAGHFPGDPIVPGAYLLAWVIGQARGWLAARGETRAVAGVARVKFLRPLRPDQPFICEWTTGADSLRFTLATDAGTVATGALVLGATESK